MDGAAIGCLAILAGAFACCIWLINLASRAQAAISRTQALTRGQYMASLESLSSDPANSSLRQQTLALGRKYSSMTRNGQGVALFDEVALMNDINAACAGAAKIVQSDKSQQAPMQEAQTVSQSMGNTAPSVEDRLAKLSRLKEQGHITGEEYEQKRSQILDEI